MANSELDTLSYKESLNAFPSAPVTSSATATAFDITKSLSTLQKQAIVRPDNPPKGISGFLFDLPEEDKFTRESDITDHFAENNTPLHEHWAVRPEMITLQGIVSEIKENQSAVSKVEVTIDPLPEAEELDPDYSQAAIEAIYSDELNSDLTNDAASKANSLYELYKNRTPSTAAQISAFQYFYNLQDSRQLCSVETPWGIFNDMAIQSITAIQGESTKSQTQFIITFKAMKFADEPTFYVGKLAGRAVAQGSDTEEGGNKAGTTHKDGDNSFLYTAIKWINPNL